MSTCSLQEQELLFAQLCFQFSVSIRKRPGQDRDLRYLQGAIQKFDLRSDHFQRAQVMILKRGFYTLLHE